MEAGDKTKNNPRIKNDNRSDGTPMNRVSTFEFDFFGKKVPLDIHAPAIPGVSSLPDDLLGATAKSRTTIKKSITSSTPTLIDLFGNPYQLCNIKISMAETAINTLGKEGLFEWGIYSQSAATNEIPAVKVGYSQKTGPYEQRNYLASDMKVGTDHLLNVYNLGIHLNSETNMNLLTGDSSYTLGWYYTDNGITHSEDVTIEIDNKSLIVGALVAIYTPYLAPFLLKLLEGSPTSPPIPQPAIS
jgi:hypothetical protein